MQSLNQKCGPYGEIASKCEAADDNGSIIAKGTSGGHMRDIQSKQPSDSLAGGLQTADRRGKERRKEEKDSLAASSILLLRPRK